MKNNVIMSVVEIPLQVDGKLEIVGKTQCRVVFKASGTDFLYAADLSGFAKNCIHTSSLHGSDTIVFFEYNLQGELRNPRKLLKSVRNKLMRAINAAYSEFDAECNHQEWAISMSIHSRFKYTPYVSKQMEEKRDRDERMSYPVTGDNAPVDNE